MNRVIVVGPLGPQREAVVKKFLSLDEYQGAVLVEDWDGVEVLPALCVVSTEFIPDKAVLQKPVLVIEIGFRAGPAVCPACDD